MPLNVGGAHHAQVSSCPRPTVGRVLAVLRPEGVGTVTVTCTAEGLAPVTVDLEVVHA